MKTFILAAAFATVAALLSAPLPAEAGYIPPDATWAEKAFCFRGC